MQNLVPLSAIEHEFTTNGLRLIKEAQSECIIYKKRSVVSTLFLLSFMKNGITFGMPTDEIRKMVAPSAETVDKDPPLSGLVMNALEHSIQLRDKFHINKCDIGLLILGFLSLSQGKHLEIFQQYRVDRVLQYNQYKKSYLITRMEQEKDLNIRFTLLSQFIMLSERIVEDKLDQLILSRNSQQY